MEQYYNECKIFIDEGYPAIYLPSHPHCKSNGTIRIHILQMEKKLGRFLKQEECVHHKDEDKLNYDLNNLMCFRTNSDHIAFHHGNIAYKNEEGIYFCNKKGRRKRFCLNCNKEIEYHSTLCSNCYKKELENARGCSVPSKEQLLKDIKTMSFVSIGQKYNVSDNAIRKWCKKYNLPYRKADIKIL